MIEDLVFYVPRTRKDGKRLRRAVVLAETKRPLPDAVREVFKTVADAHNVPVAALWSRSRLSRLCDARYDAVRALLARGHSIPMAARWLKRDPSTIHDLLRSRAK